MEAKPDFFLSAAGESEGLASPRACWKKARLKDPVRDDHMLVEIEPPLIGQSYGLGGQDITSLILSARHEGFPLFPVKEWPCHVYVARILDDTITRTLAFTRSQIEVIAWGMIFRTLDEANTHAKKVPAMSFLKPSRKKSEEVRVPEIRFLGEQEGPPERLLKDRLADFFRRDRSVSRAYLARVDFGEGKEASVVLALRTQIGPDKGMVEKVGTIFADVFNAREHLDIMFLTDSQEAQLTKTCKPFFG